MMASRTPAVSGTFYPSRPARLRSDVRGYLEMSRVSPRRVVGLVAPHAGHVYCGATAGAAFASAVIPPTCVMLAPHHGAVGTARRAGSVLLELCYRTPLGDVPPDDALGPVILERAGDLLEENAPAHRLEHSIEALLPFLQVCAPEVRIVPILLGWTDWESAAHLARAIYEAIAGRDDVLIVASSDMNHYEPASVTADKDTMALDRIIAVDGEGLLSTTAEHHISMCGSVPVACALEVSRLLGKRAGEVVAYSHSGTVDGRNDRVVGYAAALIGIG
jgi:AmmeMemoRadiSam system protein B